MSPERLILELKINAATMRDVAARAQSGKYVVEFSVNNLFNLGGLFLAAAAALEDRKNLT